MSDLIVTICPHSVDLTVRDCNLCNNNAEIERLRAERVAPDHVYERNRELLLEVDKFRQAFWDANEHIERLTAALEKSTNMITELLGMMRQPIALQRNSAERAKVLLDWIASEALKDECRHGETGDCYACAASDQASEALKDE